MPQKKLAFTICPAAVSVWNRLTVSKFFSLGTNSPILTFHIDSLQGSAAEGESVMKSLSFKKIAKAGLALCAPAALGMLPTAASAATFIGTTTGCFGLACVGASSATSGGLTFNGGSFNQADADGFLALGGLSDNLGTFTLDNSLADYVGQRFSLFVNFTSPTGSGSGSYAAALNGKVTATNTGGVFVNFNNDPISFNPPGGPPFTLAVNDVSVSAGAAAQAVSGQILTSATPAVPEPATWGMMLLGFGAIGAAMRRKQASQGTKGRVRFNFA
jgi:hypothetical protein